MQNIAIKMKKIREEAKISASELASKTGLSAAFISKLENGKYASLSLITSKVLAEGLGLTLKDFLSKLDFLGQDQSSGSTLITNALRSTGYTLGETEEIIKYAKFIKEQKKINSKS